MKNSSLKVSALASLFLLGVLGIGCGSQPIKPEAKSIKVTREDVDSDCKEIGAVEGRNLSAKGSFESALEDLKLDAARKGATHVKIEQTSGTGTAVRGVAYICP